MKRTNITLEKMAESLKPFLKQRNKIGYVAARNYRVISDILTEYFTFKDDLIRKYGAPDGEGRVVIRSDCEKLEQFQNEFLTFADIEHDFTPMMLKYDEVIGVLDGEEILAIDWMLEE